MTAKITALYAVPLSLLFFHLSYRVIGLRKKVRAALGDGGDPALTRAIRVHGNFAEYVPFALAVMALAEINGAPSLAVHLLGMTLVAGRLAHAWGVSQPKENFRYRVGGMLATFAVIVGGAILSAVV